MLRTDTFVPPVCVAMLLRAAPCSCQEYGPCEYEEVALEVDDLTPWGTRVGDDLARLVGPYQGTWRWDEDYEALDLDNDGAQIPATATIELDPATYRLVQPIYMRHTVCFSPETIAADGTMTLVDDEGEIITSFELTVTREIGYPSYFADVRIQPVEMFSDEVHPLREWDVEGIEIYVDWSEDGSQMSIDVDYAAQSRLTPTSGHGTFGDVATFTTE